MSQLAAPFGLRPAYSPSGCIRPGPLTTIASAYDTDIFQYDPVLIVVAGGIEIAPPTGRAMGTFMGVEYDDTDGQHRVRNRWPADLVATNIRAYYTQDQSSIVYEIQCSGTLTQADVGNQFDYTAPGGSTVTGLSNVSLNIATGGANQNMRVLGLNPGPDNEWGDPFPIVLVQLSEHQYTADIAAL
jgi:hypothetical protein